MSKSVDIIFNSQTTAADTLFSLASGYISQTTVLFENEQVTAVIQAKGHVAFYDADDTLIAEGQVPTVDDGKGVYEQVGCCADDTQITLRFPICQWIDNYPHCDGEHDRWDSKIVGYHTLTLDRATRTIV